MVHQPLQSSSVQRRTALRLTAFAIAWVTGACAADRAPRYVSPDLPPEQLASIRVGGGVTLLTIDGARVASTDGLRVTAGDHELSMNLYADTWTSFTHAFKAGHAYSIALSQHLHRGVRITDMTTGVSVDIS